MVQQCSEAAGIPWLCLRTISRFGVEHHQNPIPQGTTPAKDSAAVPVGRPLFNHSPRDLFLHASSRSRVQRLSLRPIVPRLDVESKVPHWQEFWVPANLKPPLPSPSSLQPCRLFQSNKRTDSKSSRRKSARAISCERMRLHYSVGEQMIDSKHYPSPPARSLFIYSLLLSPLGDLQCTDLCWSAKSVRKLKQCLAQASIVLKRNECLVPCSSSCWLAVFRHNASIHC